MTYRRHSLGRRLSMGFGLVIVLTAVMGIVAVHRLNRLDSSIHRLYQHRYTVGSLARDTHTAVLDIQNDFHRSLHSANKDAVQSAVIRIQSARQSVLDRFERITDLYPGPRSDVVAARRAFLEWDSIRAAIQSHVLEDRHQPAGNVTESDSMTQVNRIVAAIQVIIDFVDAKANATKMEADHLQQRSQSVLLLLITGILLAGISLAVIVARGIVGPVRRLGRLANRIALGLAVEAQPVTGEDEISHLTAALNAIIASNAETRTQAQTLLSHEIELREANQDLAEQTRAYRKAQEILEEQQQALQAANRELAEQKRSIETNNAALEAARRMIEEKAADLERSNRFKSEFLANMSHELRTPLNSVILLSQMMIENKEANLTDDQLNSVRTILTAGKDLLRLIGDILDLSKVEAGKLILHPEWVTPADIASDLIRQFKPHSDKKGLGFDVTVAEKLPQSIHTDRQRLEQILSNFISNALKFTESGTISVRLDRPAAIDAFQYITGARLIAENAYVAITVTDTGIGVSEAHIRSIFGPFEQINGAMNRRYGGTGLGLSISAELARLLGGAIGVQSRVGEGSVFSVIIPDRLPESGISTAAIDHAFPIPDLTMLRPDAAAARRAQVAAIEDDADAIGDGDRVILIIDDNPERLTRLRDAARARGFLTILAGDGETGFGMAFARQPQAVVLNLSLSGVSGWTVISRLKEATGLRHIPVYGIGDANHRLAVRKAGAVGLLELPASDAAMDAMYEALSVIIEKTVKDLLIVEDDPQQQRWVAKILGGDDVHLTFAETGAEAYTQVLTGRFDCMMLDLGLPDQSGEELLTRMRADSRVHHLPVVIYTGRDLTSAEMALIDESAESIIIKGANSHQKLLDETTLYLHRMQSVLRPELRRLLERLHDTPAILSGKKILLVDDDMRNVFSLKKLMEEHGMTIVAAKDGLDGLAKLRAHPDTDLVLMDIMMPEMDGFEAMTEIRRMGAHTTLPIIALTAKAMHGDRGRCIAAGANDYLAKPVDADRLFSMLRIWLW